MNIKQNIVTALFGILAVLSLSVIVIPEVASADRAGYVTPYNSTRMRNVSTNEDEYNTFTGAQTSGSGYNTYSAPSSPSTVYSSSSAPRTTVAKSTTTVAKAPVVVEDETLGEEVSGATASAIMGNGGGFLPSGLIQWLLFAILILLIVIIVRKLTGAEDHYHEGPMKHA